jgi:hypothetical protein
MRAIEDLLRNAGMTFGHATFFGRRVTKENARMANGATIAFDEARIFFVECDGPIIRKLAERGAGMELLAHTRPGDPGYGAHPEEVFPRSSLGQVIEVLADLGRLPESFEAVDGVSGDLSNLWQRKKRPSDEVEWLVFSYPKWNKVPDELVRLVEREYESPYRRRETRFALGM